MARFSQNQKISFSLRVRYHDQVQTVRSFYFPSHSKNVTINKDLHSQLNIYFKAPAKDSSWISRISKSYFPGMIVGFCSFALTNNTIKRSLTQSFYLRPAQVSSTLGHSLSFFFYFISCLAQVSSTMSCNRSSIINYATISPSSSARGFSSSVT